MKTFTLRAIQVDDERTYGRAVTQLHTKTCMCLQTRFVGSLDSLKCTIIANTKKEPLEEKETAKSLNIHLIKIQI